MWSLHVRQPRHASRGSNSEKRRQVCRATQTQPHCVVSSAALVPVTLSFCLDMVADEDNPSPNCGRLFVEISNWRTNDMQAVFIERAIVPTLRARRSTWHNWPNWRARVPVRHSVPAKPTSAATATCAAHMHIAVRIWSRNPSRHLVPPVCDTCTKSFVSHCTNIVGVSGSPD